MIHVALFIGVCVPRSLVFCVVFIDRFLSFFLQQLYCLSFYLWFLIIPLVSSNSSHMHSDINEHQWLRSLTFGHKSNTTDMGQSPDFYRIAYYGGSKIWEHIALSLYLPIPALQESIACRPSLVCCNRLQIYTFFCISKTCGQFEPQMSCIVRRLSTGSSAPSYICFE